MNVISRKPFGALLANGSVESSRTVSQSICTDDQEFFHDRVATGTHALANTRETAAIVARFFDVTAEDLA